MQHVFLHSSTTLLQQTQNRISYRTLEASKHGKFMHHTIAANLYRKIPLKEFSTIQVSEYH